MDFPLNLFEWGFTGSEIIGRIVDSAEFVNSIAAVVNTLEPWVVLKTSTAEDIVAVMPIVWQDASSNHGVLADFAVGPTGKEVPIILQYPQLSDIPGLDGCPLFPVFIPKGSQISSRFQITSIAPAVRTALIGFHGGSFMSDSGMYPKILGHGADPATSLGVPFTPGGGSANVRTWVEIVASLPRPIRLAYVHIGTNQDASAADAIFSLGIAAGPAGKEKDVARFAARDDAGTDFPLPKWFGPYFVNFEAGDRLSFSGQADIAAASSKSMDIVIMGVS